MIQQPARRAPHQGLPYPQHAPNAALLIDFDNVTMGIRSDLGKELKALLNSEVIRGKVAVQRAYADWRRYPQYIVPLAESSIDLIFAPAYGSSKKNATDLRMAIDAIELVFTRPEIGTFILMTGDSDFSSCVLKLKEYGKYVIGVGMRESSSDLLIQNCDEYYSYHALSGLTRADDVLESREDPWVLVKRAVQQMAANGDVMRTDRLKQVMLEMDPGFDEKEIGYNKFSRFVHEAANKGVLRLRKGENGQYEIVVDDDAAAKPAERRPQESEATDGRRRRGRDEPRRDRPRREEPRREEPEVEASAEKPAETPAEPAAPAAPQPQAEPAKVVEPAAPAGPVQDLESAYGLLQSAVQQLGGTNGKTVRDGDVKRRMLEIAPGFDESSLGFSKFTRFLRQAHDAEAIDLQRVNGGNYEVSLSATGKRFAAPAPAPSAAEPASATKPAAPVEERRPAAAAPQVERPAAETAEAPPAAETARPAATAEVAAPAVVPAEAQPVRPGLGSVRSRRVGRGGAPEGPPPILPGQAIRVSNTTPPAEAAAQAEAAVLEEVAAAAAETAAPAVEAAAPAAETAAEPAAEEATPKKGRARRGRRGRGRDREESAAEGTATTAPAQQAEVEAAAPPAEAASEPDVEVPAPEAAPTETVAPQANVAARARRGRRGGREALEGPPPILPGQVVAPPAAGGAPEPTPEAAPVEAAADTAPAGAEGAEDGTATDAKPAKKRRRSRGRGRQAAAETAAAPAEETVPAPQFSPSTLGLPDDRASIQSYLTAYKGVGKKTAESLVDAFGADVFQVLEQDPERVTGVLGDRRAATVLDNWSADYTRRQEAANSAAAEVAAEAATPAGDDDAKPKPRSRTRRGGRGRVRKRTEPTPGS